MDRVIARQMLFRKKLEKEKKEAENNGKQDEEERIKRKLEEEEMTRLERKQRLVDMKLKLSLELEHSNNYLKQLIEEKNELHLYKSDLLDKSNKEEKELIKSVEKVIRKTEEDLKLKIAMQYEIEMKMREEEDKKLLKFEEADKKGEKKGTKLEKGLAETRHGLHMKLTKQIASRREEKESEQFYEFKIIHESIKQKKNEMEEGLILIQDERNNEEQMLQTKDNSINREIRKITDKICETEKVILSFRFEDYIQNI